MDICEAIPSIRNKHKLMFMASLSSGHNHAAEANRVKVIKTIKFLKERSHQTNDNPVQVIQSIVADTSQDVHPYLPSRDALRESTYNRTTIFIIPENMRKTLNGSDFLVRDLTIGEEKI
ncbi:hypothetical protein C1646_760686 [Rhizophagus diaphanus]|nr:hypothetical protein C1646_760686 [Rhizophagus diaphanus] [Rhizophagus sp. MUCL 43196]